MERTLEIPRIGTVVLSQTRRARRISIRINGHGAVRLSYPYGVSQSRALDFLAEKHEWIQRTQNRLASVRSAPSHTYTPEEIEALRREAKAWLPPRTESWARRYGFRYGRLTIRAARSKWGSCTSDNNLSLSLFLMTLPERLRDFVLLHELCHTVHHNHSAEFHRLLDRCLGGKERELRSELRRYAIR